MKIEPKRIFAAGAISGIVWGLLFGIVVFALSSVLNICSVLCCVISWFVGLLQLGGPIITGIAALPAGAFAGFFAKETPATRGELLVSGLIAGSLAGFVSSLLIIIANLLPSGAAVALSGAAGAAGNQTANQTSIAVVTSGTGVAYLTGISIVGIVVGVLAGAFAGIIFAVVGTVVAGWVEESKTRAKPK